MVLVRIKDKRYHIGYNIKFFKTDIITDEVIITSERIEHIAERRGEGFYEWNSS